MLNDIYEFEPQKENEFYYLQQVRAQLRDAPSTTAQERVQLTIAETGLWAKPGLAVAASGGWAAGAGRRARRLLTACGRSP